MTEADKNFIDTCKEILAHGYSSEGTGVRTRWEDGSEANYISIVGVTNKYDVEKEFPMITLRNNTNTVKRAIDEILWIWQKKSNNINDLNSHRLQGDVELGLSDNDLNEMITYMSGASPAPKSLESFSPNRLKDFTTLATISQVSRVPGLIKLLNETNALLFASSELQAMDMNDLTKLSKSLSEEIRLILEGARKTLDTLDKLDAPVSANQKLLDQLLQMPDSEIIAMKEYMANRQKRSEDIQDTQ